jgi:hypothetical protein
MRRLILLLCVLAAGCASRQPVAPAGLVATSRPAARVATARASASGLRASAEPVRLHGPLSTEVSTVPTGPVTIAWDANIEPVAGYMVYVGNAPRVYQETHDAGAVTQFTVPLQPSSEPRYFAVSAYAAYVDSPPAATLTAPGRAVVTK